MNRAQRHLLGGVLLGHFTAAFAALGMAPFFPLILQRSLQSQADYLAGCLYVVPTVCIALSSPWWGVLADRVGAKLMLVRAQLGLAAAFLLAGFADSVGWFFIALVLQGLLGGTFGAANAYLASALGGQALVRGLTWLQGSARAALVLAPVALAPFMLMASPIELYRYLAVLPLAAAVVIWRLPDARAAAVPGPAPQRAMASAIDVGPQEVYWLQFVFVFATVATFPYFVPFVHSQLTTSTIGSAAVLFGVPHLVYLLCAPSLARRLRPAASFVALGGAFALLGLSYLGQAQAASEFALALWRVLMGVALTMGLIALHGLMAALRERGAPGRTFGLLESGSKWGAVAAGLTAGVAVQAAGPQAPWWLSAVTVLAAGLYIAVRKRGRSAARISD